MAIIQLGTTTKKKIPTISDIALNTGVSSVGTGVTIQ